MQSRKPGRSPSVPSFVHAAASADHCATPSATSWSSWVNSANVSSGMRPSSRTGAGGGSGLTAELVVGAATDSPESSPDEHAATATSATAAAITNTHLALDAIPSTLAGRARGLRRHRSSSTPVATSNGA